MAWVVVPSTVTSLWNDRHAARERSNVGRQALHVRHEETVWCAFVDSQLSPRYQRCGWPAGEVERRRHVLVAVNQQRGHLDGLQLATKIRRRHASIAFDDGLQRRTKHHHSDPLL